MVGWGSRVRKPKNREGEKGPLVRIKRFRCQAHRATISFIPPFLLPRIHYPAVFVNGLVERCVQGESVTALAASSSLPEEKTIQRWVQRIRRNTESIRQGVLTLMARCFHTFDERHLQDQRAALQEAKDRSKLRELWALLNMAAEKLSEHRFPYHYALARSP